MRGHDRSRGSHLENPFDRLARSAWVEFDKGADFALALGAKPPGGVNFNEPLGPLDGLGLRRELKDRVAGDQLLRFGERPVGYHALAAGAIDVAAAPGRFRRNMPDPIPIVVLGRLAIDRTWQAKGLGRALFRDAAMRVLQAADIIGVRGMLVEAISDDAKAFYLALGMVVSPLDPMTLMVTIADLRASLTTVP